MTAGLQDLKELTEELNRLCSGKPDIEVVTMLQGGVQRVLEVALGDLQATQRELIASIELLRQTRDELTAAKEEISRLKQELHAALTEIARLRVNS